MPAVKRMHFVCHNFLNYTEEADGTFASGFWKVAFDASQSVEAIYLHESKNESSYCQGRVIGTRPYDYQGQQRTIFICEPIDGPMEWEGVGTGEKGYGY